MISSFWSLSWRFFIARKTRAVLTLFGVSLSLMLLIVSQSVMTNMEQSVENSMREKFGDYDLSAGYTDQHFSSNDIAIMKQIRNIENVYPILYPYQGEMLDHQDLIGQPYYIGTTEETFRATKLKLIQGRFPKAGEVLLDETYLRKQNYQVGQQILLSFPPHYKEKVTIAGALEKNEQVSGIAIFNLHWLQEKTNNKDKVNTVYLKIKDVTQKEQTLRALKDHFPKASTDPRSFMDQERENLSGMKPIVQSLTFIGIVAGAFMVLSSIQISLRERFKVLSTLRLLGAKPRHLGLMVAYEALIIGLGAIVLGNLLGIGVSHLILWMAKQGVLQIELQSMMIDYTQLVINSVSVLLLILVISLFPAYSASQLPALVAYNQQVLPHFKLKHPYLYPILFVLLVFAFTLNVLIKGPTWIYALIGAVFIITLLLGMPVYLHFFIKACSQFITRLFGGDGLIAGRMALRQIRKSQFISGILMVTVILSCVGSMILETILYTASKQITEENPIQYSMKPLDRETGLPIELHDQIKSLPGVQSTALSSPLHIYTLNLPKTNVNTSFLTIDGKKQITLGLRGFDLQEMNQITPLKVIRGKANPNELKSGGVLITQWASEKFGYDVGDTIQFGKLGENMPTKVPEKVFEVKVTGVIEKMPVSTDDFTIYTDRSWLKNHFKVETLGNVFVQATSHPDLRSALTKILGNPMYSNVEMFDREKQIQKLKDEYMQRVAILMVAVMIMILVALLGLLNIIASSLRERKKELAVLRALGAKRYQILRMILAESGLLTFAGGLLGVVSSVFLGFILTTALKAQEVVIPYAYYGASLLISPVIGGLAGIFSFYFLSRQGILSALQEE